jgi:hypothetical protein
LSTSFWCWASNWAVSSFSVCPFSWTSVIDGIQWGTYISTC